MPSPLLCQMARLRGTALSRLETKIAKKQLISRKDAMFVAMQIKRLRKNYKFKPLPPGDYTAEVIGMSYKTGLPILGNLKRVKS